MAAEVKVSHPVQDVEGQEGDWKQEARESVNLADAVQPQGVAHVLTEACTARGEQTGQCCPQGGHARVGAGLRLQAILTDLQLLQVLRGQLGHTGYSLISGDQTLYININYADFFFGGVGSFLFHCKSLTV